MPEDPFMSMFPVVTVTRLRNGMWTVLLDGERIAGPYAWRETVDAFLEKLYEYRYPGVVL